MRESLKVQRGITFLHILLTQVKNDPIMHTMYVHMQEPWFHLETENFEYRSRFFPLFMEHQYKFNHDLPVEFEQYVDNDMLLRLMHGFIYEQKLKGHVKDVLENPEDYEKDYMLLAFKFFKEIEAKLAGQIASAGGVTVTEPCTLYYDEHDELKILTLSEARVMDGGEQVDAFNEFAGEDIATSREMLEKEEELDAREKPHTSADFRTVEANMQKHEAESKKVAGETPANEESDTIKHIIKNFPEAVLSRNAQNEVGSTVGEHVSGNVVEVKSTTFTFPKFFKPTHERDVTEQRKVDARPAEMVNARVKRGAMQEASTTDKSRKAYMASLNQRRVVHGQKSQATMNNVQTQKPKKHMSLTGKVALWTILGGGGVTGGTFFFS